MLKNATFLLKEMHVNSNFGNIEGASVDNVDFKLFLLVNRMESDVFFEN